MPYSAGKRPAPVVLTGLLLFTLALALRVLFLQATADRTGPYSPYYQGDTPVWLDYAAAIRSSVPFDMGLPMRPPGVAYLVAALWDGQPGGYPALRLAWCVLGAVTVALIYLVLLRTFGFKVAVVAAFLAASSTGLMIVSTAVNNETVYLLLVLSSFMFWSAVRDRPTAGSMFFWAALNGLACLVRAEHLLFFVMASAYFAWVWCGRPPRSLHIRPAIPPLQLVADPGFQHAAAGARRRG